MTDRIQGKVAQIVDTHRLVLNKGRAHGVEIGSRFAVLSTEKVQIPDPDDPKAIIGTLPIARTIVKVVSVDENISIAQTFRTLESSGIIPGFTIGPSERKDSLRSDRSTVVEELGTTERSVNVGDVVLELPGNEEFDGVVLPF